MTTIRQAMRALELDGLRQPEQAVLNVLCLRADQLKCRCKVGELRLAADTRLSERTVRDALTRLEDLGHITIERRPGKRNVYTVHVLDPGDTCRGTPARGAGDPGTSRRTPRRQVPDMKESLDFSGSAGAAWDRPPRPDFEAVRDSLPPPPRRRLR